MNDREGLSAKFGHWSALFAAYLFLAGWSYFRHYFAVFGVNAGWLDLGLNDTIAQGFAVLFGAGWMLSLGYLVVFILSLILDAIGVKHIKIVNVIVACTIALLFPVVYWIATDAGIVQANKDRGDKSSLPTITFAADRCSYRGKVVYVRTEAFYVFNLVYAEPPKSGTNCTFDLGGTSLEVPQLWVLHAGELKDIRVIHYQREVKPW